LQHYKSVQDQNLLERAKKVIPGGVNSPVRAFKNVGGSPVFIKEGHGAYFKSCDDKEFIDYICSWGPHILGHNSEIINKAVSIALKSGTSFGAPTLAEIEFAELISEIMPCMEMLRMVSSGTEATMSAARLARGYTARDYILKFDGCYHGHADFFLVNAGSGVATLDIAGSKGIPQAAISTTLSAEYNNLEQVESVLKKIGAEKFAAIIIEPVPGNMGLVTPKKGFLEGLRMLCDKHGIVLIFDEVMSGFRVALGGATQRFGVTPDLITLGKVVGGGLPVGVFGGKKEIMSEIAPLGGVYQAGTLSGNPLAVAAGMAVLNYLKDNNPYDKLEKTCIKLTTGMKEISNKYNIAMQINVCGSMFGISFNENPVNNFLDAKKANLELFSKFFHSMLEKGVYFAPSQFEAGFISIKHDEKVIQDTIDSYEQVCQSFQK